jgi:hypothetical protein
MLKRDLKAPENLANIVNGGLILGGYLIRGVTSLYRYSRNSPSYSIKPEVQLNVGPGKIKVTPRLNAETGYFGGKRHGIKWQEGDIKAALSKSNTPLGQWGSKADLQYAGEQAYLLEPGGFMDFPINANNTSIVHLPDGSTVKPDMIRVRNNGNGRFHGFPIDSKTAEPIYNPANFKKP